MAINTTLITNACNAALADPASARRHGWAKRGGFTGFTAQEDLPELRRRVLGFRHVVPVSMAQGWAS